MNTLHPCLLNPELCQFEKFFPALISKQPPPVNICRICPVCCVSGVDIEELEKFRESILKPEIFEKLIHIAGLLEELFSIYIKRQK